MLVSVKITLQGPINDRDLLAMYKSPPASLKRLRKLTQKNATVFDFVQSQGGPQKTGIMEFWRNATAKWNREHPGGHPGFTSMDGLKKAYERAARTLMRP